jgi:hypothetical protein
MALTRAFTPLFGRMGRENNILYSVGYNGFGLINGFYGASCCVIRTEGSYTRTCSSFFTKRGKTSPS